MQNLLSPILVMLLYKIILISSYVGPWILRYVILIIVFAYKNIFVSGHNKMWSDMITTNCYVLQEKNEICNPLAVHLLLCDFKNVLSFGHN